MPNDPTLTTVERKTVAAGFIRCTDEFWAHYRLLITSGLGLGLGLGISMILWAIVGRPHA